MNTKERKEKQRKRTIDQQKRVETEIRENKKQGACQQTLWSLQVRPYSPGDEVDTNYPGSGYFDDSTCFLVSPLLHAVSVLMIFGQTDPEGCAVYEPRKVTVCLADEIEHTVLAAVNAEVPEAGRGEQKTVRVDLPFAYGSVDTSHAYSVTVRDSDSGEVLGVKAMVLFGTVESGHDPASWFRLIRGAVFTRDGRGPYRCCNLRDKTFVRLHFDLEMSDGSYRHYAPELEVCLYTPDGIRESHFCTIEADGHGDWSFELPLPVTRGRRGVCYALVRCLGKPLGGMLFDLAGEREDGYWYAEDLEELGEYSPMTATAELYERLQGGEKGQAEIEDNTDNDVEKDEFDRMLDEFLQGCRSEGDENRSDSEEDGTRNSSDCDTFVSPVTSGDGAGTEIGLDRLTGLKSVKTKLESYQKVMRFNRQRIDAGLSALQMPLHSMFLGAPGTGKTTVARMMGKMLAQSGMLSRGHVVECERATLIGTCYGSAEEATRKALDDARGGVLFIDEAYQLQSDDSRDPGRMVIESLMTALADEANRDWMLILAGYPDEMRRLFDLNPGLKSRIPESNIYTFDSLTKTELMEVAERFLDGNDYVLAGESREVLLRRVSADFGSRDRSFGNARHIINLIQTEVIPAMAMRVTSTDAVADVRLLSEILPCDIPEASVEPRAERRSIGYRWDGL